jgi:hypothetical protein
MFYVYLSDAPGDPIKIKTTSKNEAIQNAKQYIKNWSLDATIEKIEYIKAV